ncbi:phosphate-selective porin O and P [Anaeromyxobacter dehalogenans 2CP-1]|uniref:Phosphate-selective porin O and P n=1 Tax=Anaeromyxobacter dehalogenans (strain ATCC BAA-258 / DSM 21875 / 2CP-1) TaxID=455488 RepID=B8JAG7_ANAD2|nr:porin [Anaeromyxobacter dehalogenans]ACL67466.1 phosphate-selective porin O and P [Anaeromyxobacter dehalogenans 2CP-1]
MNRLIAAILAVGLAPAALAQEAAAPASSAPAESSEVDTAALKGQVDALAEQLAEMKTDVSGLKKLKFSGYVQPRFGWLEAAKYEKGAPQRDGFYVRRGRFKAVYDTDLAQYVIQLDATPSGVGLKEAYASFKLPFLKGFAIDAGLQLMPFGYDVGIRSSSDLDLLERAMFAGHFLKGEYDLGVALRGAYGPVNFKVGVFNGNGVDGAAGKDNDQRKDVIGRLGVDLGMITGGVSGWYGKTIDYTSATNETYDRVRLGADLQLYLDLLPVGGTALKGEYVWGKTAIGTGAGGAGDSLGLIGYGWDVILTQNVGPWNQVAVRYDTFNPNVKLDRNLAANQGKVFITDEVSAALHTILSSNLKLSVAYYHPMNREKGDTAPSDPKKDSFVAQLQAKF